jgi:hypothetical protein
MVRTQIYFDENLFDNLRIGAKLNKSTVSAYIRKLLHEKISCDTKIGAKKTLLDLGKSAKKYKKLKKRINVSGNMDKYQPEEWR